jgi:hypothetical protein
VPESITVLPLTVNEPLPETGPANVWATDEPKVMVPPLLIAPEYEPAPSEPEPLMVIVPALTTVPPV